MSHKTQNFETHAGNSVNLELTILLADGLTPMPLPVAKTVHYALSASPGGLALIAKDSTGSDVTIVSLPGGDDGRVDIKLQPPETQGFDGTFHYAVSVEEGADFSTVLTGRHKISATIGGSADTGETALLKTRLTEAEDALHQLSMGQQVVKVDTGNGQSVTYVNSPQAMANLRIYIAELKGQINPAALTARRRPLRPYF